MQETRKVNTCSICGAEHPAQDLSEFGGQVLCPSCLDARTTVCCECGERIWNNDNEGTYDTPLCEDCYDSYYTHCTECGTLIRQADVNYGSADIDGDAPYCNRCFNHLCCDAIASYYFKPISRRRRRSFR